jgi:DNA-binding MarR family transcriptional regulator
VENQQSIKTILSFGAKSVEPRLLEQLLIGRDKNAEYLFKSVEGIVHNGNNQQILVVGQRGMGKTHLLRVLYHRCQPFINKKQLIVAYFSEEEYGVASYFDFLTRILYAFIRWNDKDKDSLQKKLEELQDTTPSEQTYFIEKIIKDYISKKPLLILSENFGDILDAMGPEEQGKFRAWMYNNNRISIIATNQSLSEDFDREDRPFYGFFNLYYLKSLTYKESLAFLISLAKLDEKPEVVKHLKTKGKAQVKAIHQLVKGNHRLLVTFYEFLKTDTLVKLSNHFIKTINDLKPYYETYIRYLPPQQQKIIRYIALSRKPQQGTIISKNCFIDSKSLSKQLNELVKKNLLEALSDQIDKRNKLYDINEPLLRISIEVGEHKEGITALFIDFLALYYDDNELTTKKLKFIDLLEKCESTEKRVFQYEIQAIDKALTQKKANLKNKYRY